MGDLEKSSPFFRIFKVLSPHFHFVLTCHIFTALALAVSRTCYSWIEALTVSFKTMTFLAIAPFFRQTTIPQSDLLDSFLCVSDLLQTLTHIFTIFAPTLLSTLLSWRKTFTVHFQAKSLLTGTSTFFLLGQCCKCTWFGNAIGQWILRWQNRVLRWD